MYNKIETHNLKFLAMVLKNVCVFQVLKMSQCFLHVLLFFPCEVIGFACFCPMSFISIIFFERFRSKGYHNIHISEYTIHSRNADKGLNVRMFHSYISLTLHLHTVFMLKLLGWDAAAHQT